MPIPKFLQDKLRAGNVVPFVGAGVSMSIRARATQQGVFPSWGQLLSDAADRLEQETKSAEAALVRSLLNINPADYLEAATRARNALGPIWFEFLKEKLDIKHEKVDPQSLELARRVWRLGSNLVITTNYDEVLKWACPSPTDLQSWDIEATVEQSFLLQRGLDRPVVWHLHGRINNLSEIILTPDGYRLLYPDDQAHSKERYQAALCTLRNQMVSKSLLFVGFSLDDEYFGEQLRTVHDIYKGAVGPHYAIVLQKHADRIRSLNTGVEPITVSGFGDPLLALMSELESFVETGLSVSASLLAPSATVAIPDYGPHHPIFYVPFKQKGDEIVGQQHVLEEVRKQLTEGKRTAIGQTAAFRGLGGLGKTQLAIEYAYRYRDSYRNGVIWINADQDIDAQLIEIAEKARWIAPESEHKDKIDIAQQRLRSYSDCLIVFDNLDDRRVLDPYLPDTEANPHLLVTSRIDYVDFSPVPVGLLDARLSRELLVKEARREPQNDEEENAAQSIVELLGGLPLALELAGAYLAHRGSVTFKQYYELLSQDVISALPKQLSSFTKHEADLYRTLRLSERALQNEVRLRDVLDLLTWSGSAQMSTDLISHLLATPNDAALTDALGLGVELRLLQPSTQGDTCSLHRLVGEVRRSEIPLETRQEWVAAVCGRLGDWFQEKRKDFSQLPQFESEIDHLKRWQENAAQFAPIHSSRLMWLQGYPAYHRGKYHEARDRVIEAKRIFDQQADANHELWANLLNDLASTNGSLGDFGQALQDLREALRIRRELLGERHPDVADSLSNLGNLYGDLGDLQKALDYSQQALAMRRELFGERHPDIAASLNNVGRWYGEQGDLQLALDYSQQALAMWRELFGERHPSVASSINNVGRWYGEQGDLQLALDYSQQALEIRRGLFGERHPAIANSLHNVGHWYGEQEDLQLALDYSQQALAMWRGLFGERHPHIATSLNNVGKLYGAQGNLQRATDYSQQALAMRRELFGERHPDIAISLHNVGHSYLEQGDLHRGLDHAQQALVMSRELFGDRHPSTINTVLGVAVNLASLGRSKEAYDLVRQSMGLAQGHLRQRLEILRDQLLSKTIQKGFRQPPKRGKSNKKKKRR